MFASLILISSLAAAGAAEPGQCAAMKDDGQRLACYDALFRADPEPPVGTPPPAEQAAAASAARAAAPSQAAAAQAAAAAVAAAPEDDFGLSGHQRDMRDGASRLDEIRAVVVEIHESRVGKPAYTFDNGQRWRQVEATSRPRLRVGATVVIKRAALGSFMATMPEVAGPPARLRREE